MPDYRYTDKNFETRLAPCVYSVEDLDLSDFGLPGLSFTGDLHIDIDDSSGDDEWYIESATACAESLGHRYVTYSFKSVTQLERDIFRAIELAVCADKNLCDLIRDECKEHGL